MTHTLKRHLAITLCDLALQEFKRQMDLVMQELAEHRALIDDYDDHLTRHTRAINAATSFVVEAAGGLNEAAAARDAMVRRWDSRAAYPVLQ